jgi:enoyl-CoA hydratase
MTMDLILIDSPAPHVQRITLNRPDKRNAISTPLRTALLDQLYANDSDPDVRVTIVRGGGVCFSAGYDLSGGLLDDPPHHTAPGDGVWSRHVTESWFSIWDLAKPVLASVHGLCIGGATELAQACDLVYVAEDAKISYPVVRMISPPDWPYHTALLGMRRAMELMLTGDPINRSTSASCIGRPTFSAYAPRSVPVPSSRRLPAGKIRCRPHAPTRWPR